MDDKEKIERLSLALVWVGFLCLAFLAYAFIMERHYVQAAEAYNRLKLCTTAEKLDALAPAFKSPTSRFINLTKQYCPQGSFVLANTTPYFEFNETWRGLNG